MTASAFYNENAPFAAAWLQELETHGHIPPGRIDQRSIVDLTPADVAGHGQRHFFAGIGGWAHALRLAGVPDDADVWTGSCPCQGLSDAGARRGFLDPRHLWPAWFALIRECRPPIIFGEQVASGLGLEWLDLVFTDLERCGYAVGAADLCAAGVGAPHRRQRLYFVAYAPGDRRLQGIYAQLSKRGSDAAVPEAGRRGEDGANNPTLLGTARATHWATPVATELGNNGRELRGDEAQHDQRPKDRDHSPVDPGADRGVADPGGQGLEVLSQQQARRKRPTPERGGEAGRVVDPAEPRRSGAQNSGSNRRNEGARETTTERRTPGGNESERAGRFCAWYVQPQQHGATRGFWDPADWVLCRDPTGGPPVARPVEPGTFPLAHGVPDRVGLLSGYGNAIVPQVAVAFILASLASITNT